jgi:hypothetical protein
LPQAARAFVTFAGLLRANGFAVAPEQTTTFLAAIDLLGPKSVEDVRRAAHAAFGPRPERAAEFDALFRAHFLGEVGHLLEAGNEQDDDVRVHDDDQGVQDSPLAEVVNETGEAATAAEALASRRFGPADDSTALRRFAREAPARLPRRRGYRRVAARRGAGLDLRRMLKQAAQQDGEVFRLVRQRRRPKPRNVLLLIDVSGSMKAESERQLRFAHVLARAVQRIEVFTFGTRLTRITRAMRFRNRDQALAAAAARVPDWDGGTRIGEALQAFLALPRFAGYARGALVLILSDGLERGEPDAMIAAMTRLSRLAWRISWLSPLASGPDFLPRTSALASVLPLIDELADGSSTERLCDHILALRAA